MNKQFLGSKLTYARNRLGVSIEDIAKLLDVTRQYIHKIETGKENKSLSSEQIEIIARELGVSASYFFENQKVSISHDRIHYRSVAIPNYVREQAKIYAEDFISICDFIRAYISPYGLEFPTFDLDERIDSRSITADDLHKTKIESAAAQVREELGLGHGPISNMVRVLENCGVIICASSDISKKVDAFCNDDYLPIVVRNESKSPVRCRFDLAHEFGHLILHKGMNNDIMENKYIEKQADYFASCLLLPKSTFITEFPVFSNDRISWDKLYELKKRWKVSIAAILFRAFDLELIPQELYQKAFIQLSHRGWRSCEPADDPSHPDYIELEKPELIRNAIQMIKNTYRDFLPSMKEELGMDAELIKAIVGMPELTKADFERKTPNLTVV